MQKKLIQSLIMSQYLTYLMLKQLKKDFTKNSANFIQNKKKVAQ